MKKDFDQRIAQPLARDYAPPGERQKFAKGVVQAVKEFEQHFVLDNNGKLVRGVYKGSTLSKAEWGAPYEVGAYLRPRKGRPPRRIPHMSHKKNGKPYNDEIRLLVGRLGFLFAQVTGEPVDNYSWDGVVKKQEANTPSALKDAPRRTPFESMLETIFQELRPILVQMNMGGSGSTEINYARNWVKDFVDEKAKIK